METRFITYSSIELAGEDRFVRWVLHGEQHHEWMRWIEQQPDIRQRIDEARKLVLSLNHDDIPDLSEAGKSELWNRIQASAQKTQALPNRRKVTELWKWGIAAAAALTLVVWINNLTSKENLYARAGEQKEFVLPEGSSVILNAGSKITYKNSTFEKDRILQLEGEAFFSVKPGSTFTVHTPQGTVTVLGTSFNVLSRDEIFEVSCYTGKVNVESDEKKQLLLSRGEQSRQEGTNKSLSRDRFIPISEFPEWTIGRFHFDNKPLKDVVAELERQYAVKVNLKKELEEIKYTGFFESGDLDEALELITWPLYLNVVKQGKKITISH